MQFQQFHTAFVDGEVLVFTKEELDLAYKDKRYFFHFFFFFFFFSSRRPTRTSGANRNMCRHACADSTTHSR
jgi:hypothetical protein